MGATNHTVHAMPIRDFPGRLADIAQQLQALDRSRKAMQAVRRTLAAPIVNRVEADMQAIERLHKLAEMPLPEFKNRGEE